MRLPWIVIGVTSALVAALAAFSAAPALATLLGQWGASSIIQYQLMAQPLVQLALVAATFAITLTLLALVAPAWRLSRILEQMEDRATGAQRSDEPLTGSLLTNAIGDNALLAPWRRMLRGGGEPLPVDEAGPPADALTVGQIERLITPALLVEAPLHLPLFRALPWLVLGFGLATLGTGIIQGLDRQLMAMGRFEGLADASVDFGTLSGLCASVICVLAALAIWLLQAIAIPPLVDQVQRCAAFLAMMAQPVDPRLLAVSDRLDDQLSRVTDSVIALRTETMAATQKQSEMLSGLMERVAQDQSSRVADLTRTSADAFISQLRETQGHHAAAALEAVTMLERQTHMAEATIAKVHETLAKEGERHASKLTKAFKDGLEAAQAGQRAQVDGALQAIQEAAVKLPQIIGAQLDMLTAETRRSQASADHLAAIVQRETQDIAGIQAAAEQLTATAAVSRETVERFIALAERLRDVNRSARALASNDRGLPLTDPETSKRLSTAISDLKRATEQTLPEF